MLARAPKAGWKKAGWTVLAALVVMLAAAGSAHASPPCMADTDCPNPECGGEVCTRSSGLFSCNAANTQGASGANDGWCADANGNADDSKCKCRGMGATCNGLYCTFTVPPGGTGGGAGGSTGTGGSASGGTSGGSTSSGGGGCSVASAPSFGGAAGIGLALAALIRGRLRRRG
jgi:hypothetical protein